MKLQIKHSTLKWVFENYTIVLIVMQDLRRARRRPPALLSFSNNTNLRLSIFRNPRKVHVHTVGGELTARSTP